jgi:phytoene dehydrogenase-like protein
MIEGQIERYAPGFRDVVIARSSRGPQDLQRYNANYIGGNINGGSADLGQLFFRPVARIDPMSPARATSSSAPRRHHPAVACTVCVATGQREACFGTSSPPRVDTIAL